VVAPKSLARLHRLRSTDLQWTDRPHPADTRRRATWSTASDRLHLGGAGKTQWLLKADSGHSGSMLRATASVMTGHSTFFGMYGRCTLETSHLAAEAPFQAW